MSAERTPREREELRQWAVEQAVEFTKRKEDYDSSKSIVHVANTLYHYVLSGVVR
jgi:hypothetical protein